MNDSPLEPDGSAAVARARRQMAVARSVHWLLLALVAGGLAAGPLFGQDWLSLVALVAIFTWVLLLVRSARLLKLLRESWAHANLGRLDVAEARAREVLETWSIVRPMTLGAVQVLSLIAQARGRHEETAQLAAFVLNRQERLPVGDRTGAHLMLVEALIAMDQLALARATAMPLYSTKLQLPEALRLLLLQLRLEARLGSWESMVQRIEAKIEMAELMAPAQSALAHALLMMGARKSGMQPWASWLGRRVGLLSDPPTLQQAEPILREVEFEPQRRDFEPGIG